MNNLQQTLDVQTQWEEIYSNPQTAHKNMYPTELVVSTVFKNFKTRVGLKALDLGCGWCNNLRFLRDVGFDAYGIEISPTAVQSMRDEFSDHVVQGTFLDLPFPDDHFSFVLDRSSIQQNPINDIPTAIQEARRVLKPGGMFFSMMVATNTSLCNAAAISEPEVRSLMSDFSEFTLDSETRTSNAGERIHTIHLIVARK